MDRSHPGHSSILLNQSRRVRTICRLSPAQGEACSQLQECELQFYLRPIPRLAGLVIFHRVTYKIYLGLVFFSLGCGLSLGKRRIGINHEDAQSQSFLPSITLPNIFSCLLLAYTHITGKTDFCEREFIIETYSFPFLPLEKN